MMLGSVCRHLKIAGRVIIARLFHVTSQQPRKLQTSRKQGLPCGSPKNQNQLPDLGSDE